MINIVSSSGVLSHNCSRIEAGSLPLTNSGADVFIHFLMYSALRKYRIH